MENTENVLCLTLELHGDGEQCLFQTAVDLFGLCGESVIFFMERVISQHSEYMVLSLIARDDQGQCFGHTVLSNNFNQ